MHRFDARSGAEKMMLANVLEYGAKRWYATPCSAMQKAAVALL